MPASLRRLGTLLWDAWTEYEIDHARYLAAAMVYYACVSLIPLLLLLLSGLGLLLRFSRVGREARVRLLTGIETSFGEVIAEPVRRMLESLSEGSVVATVISLVGLLVAGSALFVHLRLAFRAIWGIAPPLAAGSIGGAVWHTVFERVVAFVMVLGSGGMLLLGLIVVAATQQLDRLLGSGSPLGGGSSWVLTAVTSLALGATTFAVLLKVLSPVRVPWRAVGLASLVCALATLGASEMLALYGVLAGDEVSAYGLVGGFLALMVWMNVVSKVLFFGAELCKVVARRGAGAPSTAPAPGREPAVAGSSPAGGQGPSPHYVDGVRHPKEVPRALRHHAERQGHRLAVRRSGRRGSLDLRPHDAHHAGGGGEPARVLQPDP